MPLAKPTEIRCNPEVCPLQDIWKSHEIIRSTHWLAAVGGSNWLADWGKAHPDWLAGWLAGLGEGCLDWLAGWLAGDEASPSRVLVV